MPTPQPKDEPKHEELELTEEEEAAMDASLDALAKSDPALFGLTKKPDE